MDPFLIKTSQLDPLTSLNVNDFLPLVDSASHTTFRTTLDTISNWIETHVTSAYAIQALSASYAKTASIVFTSSFAKTASFLLYQGFFNGTASYAISSSVAITASYFGGVNSSAAYATNALSVSWASSSLSASYVSASNVVGTVLSASYTLSASYAITASNAITSSNTLSASNAGTASHAKFVLRAPADEPFNVYGPFIADTNGSTPTVDWSQWDDTKRCVAFILEGNSDVIVKTTVNYNDYGGTTNLYKYLYSKLLPEGFPDPIELDHTNGDADSIQFVAIRDVEGGNYSEDTAEIAFRYNNLSPGQYRVYVLPCATDRHIGPEYSVSASNSQITDVNLFYQDVISQTPHFRISKHIKSVQTVVYARQNVIQGIYALPNQEEPETPVGPLATRKLWKLRIQYTWQSILTNGFRYEYTYTSALGNGTATWEAPNGHPGYLLNIYKCLPSDHVILNVTVQPTAQIITPPTIMNSHPCYVNNNGSICGWQATGFGGNNDVFNFVSCD